MSVDRWHEAEAHGSANGLGDLSLVHRSQTSLVSVSDAAQSRHVLGHDGEVLRREQISAINLQLDFDSFFLIYNRLLISLCIGVVYRNKRTL